MVAVFSMAENDHVIPRSILGTTLNGSGLLAQSPVVGVVTLVSANVATVAWGSRNEIKLTAGYNVPDGTTTPLLHVAAPSPGALNTYAGKRVRLLGAPGGATVGNAAFTGTVVEVLGIELDPNGSPTIYTDCVVVLAQEPAEAWWVAEASAVEVVG